MKKIFLSVILSCAFHGMFSQTFTGSGGVITDNNTQIIFNLNVTGLPAGIDSISFGLQSVCLTIAHNNDADLDIDLVSPDGTRVKLTSQNGGTGNNYTSTCFTATAATPVYMSSAPFTGNFKPQGDLGIVNNFQNPNGVWQISITDLRAATQGSLTSWSLTFGASPAVPFPFASSNLPIIMINTNAQVIKDTPSIIANMGIIYNGAGVRNNITDPFNSFNGKIGIEIRGSSSQMFPKKGYGIETLDAFGNEINASLLGMPAESDWILSASYTDKTLMHNVLSYKLYNEMGKYAPRTVYCELMLNGQYMGVYMLMEKIKRDLNRVNIKKLTTLENTGINMTGGYIIKVDKLTGNGGTGWTSPYAPVVSSGGQTIFFQYEYPSEDSITVQQQSYIQQYVDSFEDALASVNFTDVNTGFRKFADENSFIDYFILNEISRNVDGYRLSTFLYKNRYDINGGKLAIGPPWDYDIAWHNANYCSGSLSTGWAYQFGNVCPGDNWQLPTWWSRMMQDTLFQNQLKCRWNYLRGNVLSDAAIASWIDTTALYLGEGQVRNFTKWPILGVYVWPNPTPIPATYAAEITAFKNWVTARTTWMDANMPGNCTTLATYEAANNFSFGIFPNPSSGIFTIDVSRLPTDGGQLEIYNVLGEKVFQSYIINPASHIDLSSRPKGIYMVKIMDRKGNYSVQKIIIR